MRGFADNFTLSTGQAISVVLGTIILFVVLTVAVRLWGDWLFHNQSPVSFAILTLLGAIAARGALGDAANASGGLIAIGTLLILGQLLGRYEASRKFKRSFTRRRPTVILVDGAAQTRELERAGLNEVILFDMLRSKGVRDLKEVGFAILERRGELTVVGVDETIEPALLADVRGADKIPPQHLRQSSANPR